MALLPSYGASLDLCQWMGGKRKCGLHTSAKSHAETHVEKVEIMSFAGKRIQLEVIILSKVRLRKYNIFLLSLIG